MKKLNQQSLLLAAALFTAGVANAQAPTNQLMHSPAAPAAPLAPQGPNNNTIGMGGTGFSTNRNGYVQDSYVEQTGMNNYANVKQSDNRTTPGALFNPAGQSASIVQTGSKNDAYQTQTLDNTSFAQQGNYRNEVGAVQRGTSDKSTQTQNGGYYNTARVTQEAGSTNSQATQTQTGGHDNSASIAQSQFQGQPNDNNTAAQTQTGDNNKARAGQQGHSGDIAQMQSGSANSADAYQGAHGTHNEIIQTQSGTGNMARTVQSSDYPQENFDYNYAKQTQSGINGSADIVQRANHSYAEQTQMGIDNRSLIQQGMVGSGSNVQSAAYTTQSGISNSVTISQQ